MEGEWKGFIYEIVMDDGFVREKGKKVMVVEENMIRRRIKMEERESEVMFGDEEGEVVMEN